MFNANHAQEKNSGLGASHMPAMAHVPSMVEGCGAVWQSMAGEFGGYGRAVAKANIETAALMSRRAMAYLELPAKLAACRQPQDIAAVQLAFWQTCLSQYQEAARQVSDCMRACQGVTGVEECLSDPEAAPLKSTTERSERDYITFPEAKPPVERAAAA